MTGSDFHHKLCTLVQLRDKRKKNVGVPLPPIADDDYFYRDYSEERIEWRAKLILKAEEETRVEMLNKKKEADEKKKAKKLEVSKQRANKEEKEEEKKEVVQEQKHDHVN